MSVDGRVVAKAYESVYKSGGKLVLVMAASLVFEMAATMESLKGICWEAMTARMMEILMVASLAILLAG